jgi:hypothetical protein
MLHGVYRATSDGADNLHAAAFTGASPARDVDSLLPSELEAGSPFPAQCCFEIAEELSPCPESEFRRAQHSAQPHLPCHPPHSTHTPHPLLHSTRG